MKVQHGIITLMAAAWLAGLSFPLLAESSTLNGSVQTKVRTAPHSSVYRARTASTRYRGAYTYRDERTYWQRHPMQKGAAIGAGVGAVGGGITGLISGRGIVRGAAIGAGTGAGVGMVRTSQTLKRHPVIRDTATGGLVGLGLGWASSRRGNTIGKTAGVGAAAGLGWGLLKDLQ